MKQFPKIGQLISAPAIQTVIRLQEAMAAAPDDLKSQIVNSFVLTDEVFAGLELFLQVFNEGKSAGFILKGGYGSGKSHFLAYLGGVCRYPEFFAELRRNYPQLDRYQAFPSGKLLTVGIPLMNYSAQVSLENAILDAIQREFQRLRVSFPSSWQEHILEQFRISFSSALVEEYEQKIASSPTENFVNALMEFLEQKKIPFAPFFSRRDFFLSLDELIRTHFPAGLVLLLDETSEFLRSRSQQDNSSEDIRFLQFLGEWNLPFHCRVILSMQEEIEETTRASEMALHKIRDRYHRRIQLSVVHIRAIFSQRLVIKLPGAESVIHDVFEQFRSYFPSWNISFPEFLEIYPIHPSTLYYLESLTNLFSKTRGMIEFFHQALHGEAGNLPLLEQPADRLLTPAAIFTAFSDKIQENRQTHRYIDHVWRDYQYTVPRVFTEPEEREAALDLVRLLILTEISLNLPKLTIRAIAEILGQGIDPVDPGANLAFIQYLIEQLAARSSYIKRVSVDNAFEDIVQLTMTQSVADRFQEEVARLMQRHLNLSDIALSELLQSVDGEPLSLGSLYNRYDQISALWQDSSRRIRIQLSMPDRVNQELAMQWRQGVEDEDIDLVLVLGFPVVHNERMDPLWRVLREHAPLLIRRVFYWQPDTLGTAEREDITRWYAETLTFNKLVQEQPAFFEGQNDEIARMLDQAKKKCRDIILKAYFPPRVHSCDQLRVLDETARLAVDLKTLTRFLAYHALDLLYPDHKKIKSATPEPPLETVGELIDHIQTNLTGIHFFLASISHGTLLKNLTEKLGLIKSMGQEFMIDPNPGNSPFLRELLKIIENSTPSYSELYRNRRFSDFGVSHHQLILSLYFLAQAGYVELILQQRAMRSDEFSLSKIRECRRIAPGSQVSELFLSQHDKLKSLIGKIKPSELHFKGQENAWAKLIEFKQQNEPSLNWLINQLKTLSHTPPFGETSFLNVLTHLYSLASIITLIKPGLSSKQGLDNLLTAIKEPEELEFFLTQFHQTRELVNDHFPQVVVIFDYLNCPQIFAVIQNTPLESDYEELSDQFKKLKQTVTPQMIQTLFKSFESFRNLYRQLYSETHQKWFPPERLAALQQLQQTIQWQLLDRLNQIQLISAQPDFQDIRQQTERLIGQFCSRDPERELERQPFCICQANPSFVPVSDWEEQIEAIRCKLMESIHSYIDHFSKPEFQQKIVRYQVRLVDWGKTQQASLLNKIIHSNWRETPAISELLQTLIPPVITLIREALSDKTVIVAKEISTLISKIAGKKLLYSEARRLIDDWLSIDQKSEETFLSFDTGVWQSQQEETTGSLQPLPAFLQQYIRSLALPQSPEEIFTELIIMFLYSLAQSYKIPTHWSPLTFNIGHGEKELVELNAQFDLLPQEFDLENFLGNEILQSIIEGTFFAQAELDALIHFINQASNFPQLQMRAAVVLLNDFSFFLRRDKLPALIGRNVLSDWLNQLRDIHDRLLKPVTSWQQFPRFCANAVVFFRDELQLQLLDLENRKTQRIDFDISIWQRQQRVDKAQAFESLFQEQLSQWDQASNQLETKIRKTVGDEHGINLLVIDGLRIDFYLRLRESLWSAPHWLCEYESFLLSPMPTTTQSFYAVLADLNIELFKSVERDYHYPHFLNSCLDTMGNHHRRAFIVGFLDEKLHTEKNELALLFQETLSRLEQFFQPIPTGFSFYLCADHGFSEKSDYRSKDQPRYMHQGQSSLDRLVPWVKLTKSSAPAR